LYIYYVISNRLADAKQGRDIRDVRECRDIKETCRDIKETCRDQKETCKDIKRDLQRNEKRPAET